MYIHHCPMVSCYAAKTRACIGFKQIPYVERYSRSCGKWSVAAMHSSGRGAKHRVNMFPG